MSCKKKQWSKPQLMVLDRCTPDESVLAGCKQLYASPGVGPNNSELRCSKPCGTKCNANSAS